MSEIERVITDFMTAYDGDRVQMFNSRSALSDKFEVLYKGDEGIVRYCSDHNYIEVLGAKPELFNKVFRKYGY